MNCLANIKFLDALDQPIEGLAHQIWVNSMLISDHVTSSTGESIWIRRPIGTIIDVHVKSITSGEFKSKLKIELIGEKTVFIVRSPKILLKGLKLTAKDVATGSYVRSTYIVATGDYLERIATQNRTTTLELMKINGLKDDRDIHPGQVLKIPIPKTENLDQLDVSKSKLQQEKLKTIVVQEKDTLSLIAKLTANSIEEIKILNSLNSFQLRVNQKLKVYDRATMYSSQIKSKKEIINPKNSPQIIQGYSKNKEQTPVSKVKSSTSVSRMGLLPEACGGEKHYKRTLARIDELHPFYQPYVVKLINEGYRQLKICWVVTDGYRSPSAQDALPSANTRAKGLTSYHQYGLAIDLYSVRDGEIVLYNTKLSQKQRVSQTEADHKKLGPIGEKLGLIWGGRWKNIVDNPHYELHPNGKTWRVLKPKLLEIGVSKYKQLKF